MLNYIDQVRQTSKCIISYIRFIVLGGGGSGGGMGYAFQATNEMEAYISAPLLYIFA